MVLSVEQKDMKVEELCRLGGRELGRQGVMLESLNLSIFRDNLLRIFGSDAKSKVSWKEIRY